MKAPADPTANRLARVERVELHVAQDDLGGVAEFVTARRDAAVARDHALQAFVHQPGRAAVVGALDVVAVDHVDEVRVVRTDEEALRLADAPSRDERLPGGHALRPLPEPLAHVTADVEHRVFMAARGLHGADARRRQERPHLLDGAAPAVTEVRDDEQRPLPESAIRQGRRDKHPGIAETDDVGPSLAGHVGQQARVRLHAPTLAEAEILEGELRCEGERAVAVAQRHEHTVSRRSRRCRPGRRR